MMARLIEAGIILLLVVWSVGVAARAEDVTPVPAETPSEIVITDDIQPYFGPLGPDNPIYGLKVALENLDEAFTFNTSEKVMKQMMHAELRIAEIKGLLLMNKSVEAERALDEYFEKMNITALDISSIPVRNTAIANAYRLHVKHELVLWDLLQENPNSTRLLRAYNRSLDLEEKFIEKAAIRIEKQNQQMNRITAKVIRIDERTQEQGEDQGAITETSAPITPDQGKGREKQVEKGTGAAPGEARTTTPAPDNGSGKDKGDEKNGKGPK
jgi:hypothetical protein